jgi:hypothetical protein
LNRKPGDTPNASLFWRFPYALPNVVAAAFFLFGITTGVLFLHETLASHKNRRDYGIEVGKKLITIARNLFIRLRAIVRRSGLGKEPRPPSKSPHHSRLLASKDEELGASKILAEDNDKPPSYSEVLTRQTVLYLFVYGVLAMHNTAFDQIIAVFMHHPRTGPAVDPYPMLPFKFNQGFGMGKPPTIKTHRISYRLTCGDVDSSRIGILFTLNGFAGIFFQFILFPPLARHFGTLACLHFVLHAMPLIYLIIPFTAIISDPILRQAALLTVWLCKSLCTTFAFPCSTILLTNSASSLKALGTINGIATSVGAIGRAIGPTLAGGMFSWGVKEGYLIAPFWLLTVMGILAWIPMYALVEGEGFGDDEGDTTDEDEDEDYEADDEDGTIEPIFPADSTRSISTDTEESENEVAPLLSRASTHGSQHLSRYDSTSSSQFAITDDSDINGSSSQVQSSSQMPSSHISRTVSRSTARGRILRRRSSAPIGTGPGFRRMSSNLGASRSGYGNGAVLGGE